MLSPARTSATFRRLRRAIRSRLAWSWTPDFDSTTFTNWIFSIDYYDIKVNDYIGTFSPQEILNGCYAAGAASSCDKIVRVGGTLGLPGSGVETYTTNLDWWKTSGAEFAFAFGVGLGGYGDLTVSGNVNQYFESERRSVKGSPIIDCPGYYGVQCENPLPETRWIQRTTWNMGIFEASYLWRHYGSTEVEPIQKATTYEAFRSIDSYDYFDLYAGVTLYENVKVSVGVTNVFDKDPPIVGNSIGDTAYNAGNTYPSMFDSLGRYYTVGVDVKF